MGSLALDAPLLFEPILVAKPWGGRDRLRRLGLPVPDAPPTGEVWLLSDVEGKSSVVAAGAHRGRTLRELVRADAGAILGAAAGATRFPLLVKILDVDGKLSVQVHPNDRQARQNGDGHSGKFEAWAVLEAAAGARVSLGLDSALSPDEVRALVAREKLDERLNTFAPAAGDAYVITPGTIHAALGGVLFLEVQETADVTYRLYDWGARGLDGKPRELHVEKALACSDLRAQGPGGPPRPTSRLASPGVHARAIVDPGRGPFVFEVGDFEPGARLAVGGRERAWIFVAIEGRATLEGFGGSLELPRARASLWPAALPAGEIVAHDAARIAWAYPA